jgi:hypothetical protein
MDSIAFGGLTYRNRMPVSSSIFWKPQDDKGTLSLLLMPGDWSPNIDPTKAVWRDSSGYGRNAVIPTGVNSPGYSGGCPVFDGASYLTIYNASLADNLSYPNASMSSVDNGSVIVIAQTTAPLPVDAADYNNPGFIAGTGASPGLYHSDTNVKCVGYDVGAVAYIRGNATGGTPSAGQRHIFAGAWDSGGIYASVDGNSFNGTAWGVGPLSTGNIGADTWVGRSYGAFYTGTILLVAVYPSRVSPQKLQQWYQWARRTKLIV